MEQFETIVAEYRPLRTDDLVPDAEKCIGRVYRWQAVWIIEDGPYAGQWAMAYCGFDTSPLVWVPLCDLRVIDEDKPRAATPPTRAARKLVAYPTLAEAIAGVDSTDAMINVMLASGGYLDGDSLPAGFIKVTS